MQLAAVVARVTVRPGRAGETGAGSGSRQIAESRVDSSRAGMPSVNLIMRTIQIAVHKRNDYVAALRRIAATNCCSQGFSREGSLERNEGADRGAG